MSHSLLETNFKHTDRAPFVSASPDKDCCSICLDPIVSDDRYPRSLAKLQCGHEFHLMCVSLAFSTKKRMECPNCRNVESEEWKLVEVKQTPELHDATRDRDIIRDITGFEYLDSAFSSDFAFTYLEDYDPDSFNLVPLQQEE